MFPVIEPNSSGNQISPKGRSKAREMEATAEIGAPDKIAATKKMTAMATLSILLLVISNLCLAASG
jgi:hypothetical protein